MLQVEYAAKAADAACKALEAVEGRTTADTVLSRNITLTNPDQDCIERLRSQLAEEKAKVQASEAEVVRMTAANARIEKHLPLMESMMEENEKLKGEAAEAHEAAAAFAEEAGASARRRREVTELKEQLEEEQQKLEQEKDKTETLEEEIEVYKQREEAHMKIEKHLPAMEAMMEENLALKAERQLCTCHGKHAIAPKFRGGRGAS